MRSLKEYGYVLNGVRLTPGKYYVLEFLSRTYLKEYLFEFDCAIKGDEKVYIKHRGNWVVDFDFNKVRVCNGIENLVTLPCGEDIKIKKYRKEIDWDNV